MEKETKSVGYARIRVQLAALLRGLDDPIAAMATCSSVLHEHLGVASWTGFYRLVEPDLLRIGPYQGPLGCLEIPCGKGVCGTAAAREETQIVPDVHAFPGHIACDSRALSEIVVPVHNAAGRLVAVLDIDSHLPAAFDEVDGIELKAIVALLSPCFGKT